MYQYVPHFRFNSLQVLGQKVPLSLMAKDSEIPRLLFKMFCEDKSKEELANDADLMFKFFGCKQKGSRVMDELPEDDWLMLKNSVSAKGS